MSDPILHMDGDGVDFNQDHGHCPVCWNALYPRDRRSGKPLQIMPGLGDLSRVQCSRCRSIIEQVTKGNWVQCDE